MKIEDYKAGTSFITTAVLRTNKSDKVFFTAFGIDKKHAHYYSAKPDDVVDVKCTIIEEDVIIGDKYKDKNYDPNSVDYFALITWEDNDNLDISLISPNIKVYNICFPYVIDEHLFYNKDVITMLQDGLFKVVAGFTTTDEILKLIEVEDESFGINK